MESQDVGLRKGKEKVLLVVVDFKKRSIWKPEDIAHEMKELAIACGGDVLDSIICRTPIPTASYLITEGKLKEIEELCKLHSIETVIFSEELKGSQQRNLEEVLKLKTIDRTQLILDIFARHARSEEGKMQVELAQLDYLLPRLVGKGIELSRLGGGIGTSGPGETKLEVDRRRIAQRIDKLRSNLKDVVASRQTKRKKRQEQGIINISLVGYTNAGKSTLLNRLTQADQLTRDGFFTTLDPLSRQLVLPNNHKVVVSDTVGFMHDLSPRLIEAFKATLEEVKESEILLHVIDISNPQFRNCYQAVNTILQELGILDKPTIVVFNKVDCLEDRQWLESLKDNFEEAVVISAATGEHVDKLLEKIMQASSSQLVEIHVDIPIHRMDLVNLAHKEGEVYSIKYYNDHINLRVSLPTHLASRFENIKQN